MKRRASLYLTALVLVACNPQPSAIETDTPPAPETAPVSETVPVVDIPGYDDTAIINDFWSGEYPDGFTIMASGVTTLGRAEMKLAAPRTIECALPKGANYQIWNDARYDADELRFVSVNFPSPATITQDVQIETFVGDTPITLDLKAGDVISYQYYVGEGFFIGKFEGVDYDFMEEDLIGKIEYADAPPTDQWVNVRCDGEPGQRAWLLYREVIETPGIAPSEITGYGTSSDVSLD